MAGEPGRFDDRTDRAAAPNSFAARRDAGLRTVRTLAAAVEQEDDVTAIAALHALGQVPRALDDLARSLQEEPGPLRAYRALTGARAGAARV